MNKSARLTVGVILPSISQTLAHMQNVQHIKDVLNRVAGQYGLDYNLMTASCGGKVRTEWYKLTEGEVVSIDYPYEQLPEKYKGSAADGASGDPRMPRGSRANAAVPIKAPEQSGSQENIPQAADNGTSSRINKWMAKVYGSEGNLRDLTMSKRDSPRERHHQNPTSRRRSGIFTVGINTETNSVRSTASSVFGQGSRKTHNPVTRVIFKCWTGQHIPIQLHPENRIATIVKSLIRSLQDKGEGITPDQLIFRNADTYEIIPSEDKMSFIYPDRPAEVYILVDQNPSKEPTSAGEKVDVTVDEADDSWE
ncbi:hypothetical protein TWF730_002466 [Orbilia blumenaviensis]|uniref:Uncharacterized protein n=1 Tax=Orbilia blumenaviensis TaxID=1796055 RepID=A0AAV9UC92_9PEZI